MFKFNVPNEMLLIANDVYNNVIYYDNGILKISNELKLSHRESAKILNKLLTYIELKEKGFYMNGIKNGIYKAYSMNDNDAANAGIIEGRKFYLTDRYKDYKSNSVSMAQAAKDLVEEFYSFSPTGNQAFIKNFVTSFFKEYRRKNPSYDVDYLRNAFLFNDKTTFRNILNTLKREVLKKTGRHTAIQNDILSIIEKLNRAFDITHNRKGGDPENYLNSNEGKYYFNSLMNFTKAVSNPSENDLKFRESKLVWKIEKSGGRLPIHSLTDREIKTAIDSKMFWFTGQNLDDYIQLRHKRNGAAVRNPIRNNSDRFYYTKNDLILFAHLLTGQPLRYFQTMPINGLKNYIQESIYNIPDSGLQNLWNHSKRFQDIISSFTPFAKNPVSTGELMESYENLLGSGLHNSDIVDNVYSLGSLAGLESNEILENLNEHGFESEEIETAFQDNLQDDLSLLGVNDNEIGQVFDVLENNESEFSEPENEVFENPEFVNKKHQHDFAELFALMGKVYRNGDNIYFFSNLNDLNRRERKLLREYLIYFQTDGKRYVSLNNTGLQIYNQYRKQNGVNNQDNDIKNLLLKVYQSGENLYWFSNGLNRQERKIIRAYPELFQTDGKRYVSLTNAGSDTARNTMRNPITNIKTQLTNFAKQNGIRAGFQIHKNGNVKIRQNGKIQTYQPSPGESPTSFLNALQNKVLQNGVKKKRKMAYLKH